MSNPIRDSFDHIHADESLKQRTRDFLAYQRISSRRRTVRRLCAALACLVPLLLGTYWAYFHPVAVISVDVNPSIELGINRFDRVIWVKGYNESGQALAQRFSVCFMNYAAALHEILSDQQLSSYLQEEDEISILIISRNTDNDMVHQIESCAAEHQQTTCHAATMREVEQAHEAGLSYGKYIAFLELQALEPAFTPDDVRDMTMREIRDLIARLSAEDTSTAEPVLPPESEETEQTSPAVVPSDTHHGTGHQYHNQYHH